MTSYKMTNEVIDYVIGYFKKELEAGKKPQKLGHVFAQLVKELGHQKGLDVFDWYIKTYTNDGQPCDDAPAVVLYEVFGI